MLRHLTRISVLVLGTLGLGLTFAGDATAHRSGCHAAHSCPSDTGSYICGDTGHGCNSPSTNTTPTRSDTSNTPQTTDRDCADFATQQDAQSYFDSRGGSSTNNVDNLDADHDGIPCESLPTTRTTRSTLSSDNPCASYTSQTAAQRTYNTDPSAYTSLDSDGDGRACELLSVRATSTETRRLSTTTRSNNVLPRSGTGIAALGLSGTTLVELGAALTLLAAYIRRRHTHHPLWENRAGR